MTDFLKLLVAETSDDDRMGDYDQRRQHETEKVEAIGTAAQYQSALQSLHVPGSGFRHLQKLMMLSGSQVATTWQRGGVQAACPTPPSRGSP